MNTGSFSQCHDKVLFEAIASGSEAAFEELFHRYKATVYGSAYKWTKSNHVAEEIAQEVFIRLWTSRTALKEVEEPVAYIYRIISNRVKDYLQSDLNRENILRKVREEQPAFSNITEDTIAVNTTNRLITEAMDKLSGQKRNIYFMNRQEGKSVKEIADELHISPNTVKTHLYEALHMVRNYLRNAEGLLFLILSLLPFLKK